VGTNTLSTRSDLQTIIAEWFNDLKTLLCIDLVPRNISGVPTDAAGSLGSSTYRWKDAYFSGAVYVGGVDISQTDSEWKDATRILSGKAKTSGAPDFLALGTGLAATFEATTTDVVCYIEDVQYTFDTDLSYTGLTAAPSSNNTCLVNQPYFLDREFTRTLGEWDDEYIAIDNIGSEITALDGTIAAFKVNSEIIIALVDTTNNRLKPLYRGFAGTTQETITNNDTLYLYKINSLLLKSDGIVKVASTYWPESVATAPAAGTTGKIYFERDTGKVAYDDGSAISYNYVFLGFVLCNSAASAYVQCSELDKSWRPNIEMNLAIKDTSTVTIKRGSYVNVAGEIVWFVYDLDITTSADMAGSETVAASKQYYIYVSNAGVVYISINAPRNVIYPYRGFYHTSEYWRCIGEIKTNGATEIELLSGGVISDHFSASSTKDGLVSCDTQTTAGNKSFTGVIKSKNSILSALCQAHSGLLDWSGKFYEKHFVITTIAMGTNPAGICASVMNKLFVANAGSNNVTVINATSHAVAATITCGSGTNYVGYCPSTNRVYAANTSTTTLTVIDCMTNAVVATVTVGANPNEPCYCPTTDEMWVCNWGASTLSVINCATNAIAATITHTYSVGNFAYSPKSDKMYFCYSGYDKVLVYDCVSHSVLNTIDVGDNPQYACYCPSTDCIFVTNISSDNVSVIDCASNLVVALIAVGDGPYGIAYNPNCDRVYVANSASDNVSVINPATNAVVATVTVGDNPWGIAMNHRTGFMNVTNFGSSDNVSVINSF
jgi:YVTN family beta-propeller protein